MNTTKQRNAEYSDPRIRNLISLSLEYRQQGNALRGYEVLNPLIEKNEDGGISFLLRHHSSRTVHWPELALRFEIDALIEFYNLCFVSILAGFAPANLTEDLNEEIVKVLSQKSVRRYFSEYYPYFLTQVTLAYVQNGKEVSVPENQTGLFYSFLMLNQEIKKDKDITAFLNLLDFVSFGDAGINHLIAYLKGEKNLRDLIKEKESPMAMALFGFIKYSDFLNSFKTILDGASSYPLMQSAMWLFHGYYIDRLGVAMSEIFNKGFEAVANIIATNYDELFKEFEEREPTISDGNQKRELLELLYGMRDNILYVLNPRFKDPINNFYYSLKA